MKLFINKNDGNRYLKELFSIKSDKTIDWSEYKSVIEFYNKEGKYNIRLFLRYNHVL